MKYEFLPEETVKNFKILTQACEEVCPNCVFSLVDSDGNEVWCSLPETLLEGMDGGDEEYVLEVWETSKRQNKLAWFGIIPYEPDGVCWNYGSSETGEKIFKLYFERINADAL